MLPFTFVGASTNLRASLISFDYLSATDLLVDVAHTFYHFLHSDTWQEYGPNGFGTSIRTPSSPSSFVHVGDAWFYKGAL